MPVIIHDVVQGSEEWKAIRSDLYTGSNADKLLRFGKIPYSKGSNGTWGGNFYTERGHTLEDEAIELYERIIGYRLTRPGFITNTKYPECGYSPDALDEVEQAMVEVKAFQGDKHLAVAKYTKFNIVAQIEFGKFIAELKKGVLLLYNPDLGIENALIIVKMPFRRAVRDNFYKIVGGVR